MVLNKYEKLVQFSGEAGLRLREEAGLRLRGEAGGGVAEALEDSSVSSKPFETLTAVSIRRGS